jgi:lipopolysaccharide export LptBFGC system permease protein LptF
VAYVGAAILVAMIVVSQVSGADALSNLLSLAIGMVVAPIVTIGLGVHIFRAASGAPEPVDGR